MNLATIIEPHPGEAVAVVSRGHTITYGALRDQVAGLRGSLVSLGIEPGDRVGMLCANNPYFVLSYLAILGAGAVAVPINPLSPAAEMAQELATVGARAVVVGPRARAAWSTVDRSSLPVLEHVIASQGHGLRDALTFEDLLAGSPTPLVERHDDDVAVLMFTSGTAGSPRAAMLSHGNLRANLEQTQLAPGRALVPGDVVLGVLPLFHIFGLNVVLGLTLFVGASVVLVERFDPSSSVDTIREWGVTAVSGAPPMWTAWAGLPDVDPAAFAGLRIAASGAAKLPEDVAERFEARFGVAISEGYGLTEAAPVVTSAAGLTTRHGSIGVPLPGVELRLVDEQGDDVLVGDAGEIWVRGPGVFKGYWNDPEATRAALTADGWLRTGDIAVVADDGRLFLVDRIKDLIIVSGFNVFPAEVEEVLLEHPDVREAAVVGVAHPYTGEAVKAYVVVEGGASVEEDELIEFCADRLARYKCPSKIMFVDELPRGLGGKVLRRVLR
ncbi:MAG: long-chain fatty acid--CoA ligase [Acidimicrobiales bacterium]|nr:long-chain fatty acid--CoA ligase [Acidimicrobiales bacterium]